MMPIIRPLYMPYEPLTEYQKERAAFAEMKVALRRRKRRVLLSRVFPHRKSLFRSLLSAISRTSPDLNANGDVRTTRASDV
jgi:hypothetical protein